MPTISSLSIRSVLATLLLAVGFGCTAPEGDNQVGDLKTRISSELWANVYSHGHSFALSASESRPLRVFVQSLLDHSGPEQGQQKTPRHVISLCERNASPDDPAFVVAVSSSNTNVVTVRSRNGFKKTFTVDEKTSQELERLIQAVTQDVRAFRVSLKDDVALVRAGAATGLGNLGSRAKETIPDLEELLKDEDWAVRVAAAESIVRLDNTNGVAASVLASAARRQGGIRFLAVDALTRVAPAHQDAVSALAAALEDTDEGIRERAVFALERIGPEAMLAVPNLIKLLSHADSSMRWRAAKALGRIGPRACEAVPALRVALCDDSTHVRESAADALKHIEK